MTVLPELVDDTGVEVRPGDDGKWLVCVCELGKLRFVAETLNTVDEANAYATEYAEDCAAGILEITGGVPYLKLWEGRDAKP